MTLTEQFFMRCGDKAIRGRNEKQGKKLVRKGVKKYFFFSIRVMDDWH